MRYGTRGPFARAMLIILIVVLGVGLVGSAFIGSCSGPPPKTDPQAEKGPAAPEEESPDQRLRNVIAQLEGEAGKKPSDADVLKGLARAHMELAGFLGETGQRTESGKELEAALAAYSKALAVSPNDATLLAELALTFSHLGRAQDARDTADKAVSLDPGSAVAHFYRGLILAAQGDTHSATREWETVVKTAPGSELAARAGQLIQEVKTGK